MSYDIISRELKLQYSLQISVTIIIDEPFTKKARDFHKNVTIFVLGQRSFERERKVDSSRSGP